MYVVYNSLFHKIFSMYSISILIDIFTILFVKGNTHQALRRKISDLGSDVLSGPLVCEMDNSGRMVHYTLAKKERMKFMKLDKNKMPYYFRAYPVDGKPGTLDVVARFLFPFVYFCFNFIFWKTYSM